MDKKEKIIKTAIRLFVKQGFENTPTSQISKEAGVATGTLFHHFETKEDLINAAYLYVKKMAMDSFRNPDSNLPIKEQLRYSWNAALEWGFKNKTEIEFLNRFSSSIYVSRLTREEGASIMEPLTKIIEKGSSQGLFKDFPIHVLAYVYYGLMKVFLDSAFEQNKLDKKFHSEGFNVLWDALEK